jgi:hypothetical protein
MPIQTTVLILKIARCPCVVVKALKGGSRGEQIGSSVVFPVYKQGKIVAPGMGQLQCINHSTRVLKSPPIHIHYSMSMSATKTQNCTSNGIILKHCSIETTKIYVLMLALMNLAHVSQDRFLDPTRKMQLSACAP